MNFQEMYNTSALFCTPEFRKTSYNVFKKLLIYCLNSLFFPLCFNALSDHHCFLFIKSDIIKDSVSCDVVAIHEASFILEKFASDQLAPRTN